MLNPALDILHHNVRHQRAHLTVGLSEVPEEGDNLAGDVVPVDVLVGVSVGGAEVEGSHEVVEVVVNTIQVSVLCCVDQNCRTCQGVVKSLIGKFLRSAGREEVAQPVHPGHGVQAPGEDEGGDLEVEHVGRVDADLWDDAEGVDPVNRGEEEHPVHGAAAVVQGEVVDGDVAAGRLSTQEKVLEVDDDAVSDAELGLLAGTEVGLHPLQHHVDPLCLVGGDGVVEGGPGPDHGVAPAGDPGEDPAVDGGRCGASQPGEEDDQGELAGGGGGEDLQVVVQLPPQPAQLGRDVVVLHIIRTSGERINGESRGNTKTENY